jgi:ribose/xylose/arabinose/galactoside ABC-type transport system permease subunit
VTISGVRSRSTGAAAVHGGFRSLRRLGAAQGGGLVVALIGMGIYFTVSSPAFLTRSNLTVVLLQISILGMVAVPGAMLLVSGALDLSVGSVAGLGAASFGEFNKIFGLPLGWSIVLALCVGALWGLCNGILVSYFRCSPVIVTLAGFAGAAGVAQFITSDNTRYGFGSAFAVLGNGVEWGLPVPVIIFFVVFIIGAYVWYRTPVGRHLIGIGANREAAKAVGVSVGRLPCIIYVLSGIAAASGGLILTSQLDAASVQIGQGLELQVLTAILLGGVAFNGGRGSLWGTLAGILFIGVLNDGLVLINVGPYVASMCVGLALIVAAILDVVYQRLESLPARAPQVVVDNPDKSVPGDRHEISVGTSQP